MKRFTKTITTFLASSLMMTQLAACATDNKPDNKTDKDEESLVETHETRRERETDRDDSDNDDSNEGNQRNNDKDIISETESIDEFIDYDDYNDDDYFDPYADWESAIYAQIIDAETLASYGLDITYVDSDDEDSMLVMFLSDEELTDVKFEALNAMPDLESYYLGDEPETITTFDEISPIHPVIVQMDVTSAWPDRGLSYIDANGYYHTIGLQYNPDTDTIEIIGPLGLG